MNICLKKMTIELSRIYHSQFVLDPDLFADKRQYQPYVYSEESSDATVARYKKMGRIYLAVMLGDDPIGEVILKGIDRDRKCCALGISMRSDEFKSRGFGTQAEILALRYAFEELGMETVFADALIQNTRSQRVLAKAGFKQINQDRAFVYYRCDKPTWSVPETHQSDAEHS